MKHLFSKFIIIIVFITLISVDAWGQIAAWNLTSTNTNATTTIGGLTASAISVVPSSVAISYQVSPGDIYCGTWSTSSTFSTSGKYWEFSITPNFGYEISISSMTFKAGRTATGPSKMQVQYSLDGFATIGATALGETANSNTSTLDPFSLTTLPPKTTTSITFRIWGYGASSTGNFRLNNIVINGTAISNISPGSGIGSASVSPYMWGNNASTLLQFVIKPLADTINGIRIIKPSVLNWNTNAVTISPQTITPSFNGDTIQMSGIELKVQDSLVVSIVGVTAIDTTNIFPILVQTYKGDSPYGQVSSLPQVFVYGSPRPISVVKSKDANGNHSLLNKWAVIKGIVTVANEFASSTASGGPAYIQDATGGATLYDTAIVNNVQRGDEIIVIGQVAPFNGLFELAPCSLLKVVSEGNTFDTTVTTISQLTSLPISGVEPYEGRLVRINNITSVKDTAGNNVATAWTVTGSGTNYRIYDATGSMLVRISPRTNLANLPTPVGKFDLVCVVGQFFTSYQVLPRSFDDVIVVGSGPHIISGIPYESNIKSNGLTFNWQTDSPGNSIVNFGPTNAYGSTVTDTNKTVQHSVTITGLNSASLYHVQIGTANDAGTTYTQDYLVSTASQTSSGTINVYFNQSVNTALARGEQAQVVNLSQKLINRINAATYSIDAALYSLFGTVGSDVVNALIAAKTRGVKVRVIGEADNTGLWASLTGIPYIFDTYDALNGGVGLMHNKFVIIDNRDAASDLDDWVWMGSWNATNPGNDNDAQNVVEIQDKALANAYTTEFNEMWGSDTDTPNATASRFGARKLNNTPHSFNINGTRMELYFSPSDGTNSQIVKTLNRADESINFAILSFTQNDIGKTLMAKKNAGVKVRGVIDNRTDTGEEYDTLFANGVDVHLKANLAGFLHHKYAIIDANGVDSNKYVITGSHNWSSSAETKNNENTLIIRSARLANLYVQEFSKRYTDAGGTGVLLNVGTISSEIPNEFQLLQNYPNPFNPSTTIQFSIARRELVTISIFDILGREITTLVNGNLEAGKYSIEWNAMKLSSGVYFYRMNAGSFIETRKLVFQK